MEELLSAVSLYKDEIIIIVFILSFTAFVLTLINYRRTTKIINNYRKMMGGMDNKNLEYMLNKYIDIMDNSLESIKDLDHDVQVVSSQLEGCIQKVGVVRYNPFDGMGGDQSFSLALLDGKGDGVILTGLFSRHTSSIYAKPLVDSKSKYPLSEEEKQAIKLST